MTSSEGRLVLREDAVPGVAVLTVNRPDKLNAMNKYVIDEIHRHLDDIERDDNVDVVVMTGSGEKAFVAGADIGELNRRIPYDGLIGTLQRLTSRIADFPLPTIAAVNGFAFGGGTELALACDIRIGSTSAQFALPETGIGVIPGAGGTQRLARIVGIGVALDVVLSGSRLKADRAYSLGLITNLVEPSELRDAMIEKAQQVQSRSPLANKLAKQVISRGFDLDRESGLLLERLAMSLAYSSDEKKEGTQAFLEKRTPDFHSVHHDRVVHRNHHAQSNDEESNK